LSLLGAFLTSRWYVVVASTGVILAAVYLLWAVQRAFMGEPDEENNKTRDIGFREICTVAPLRRVSSTPARVASSASGSSTLYPLRRAAPSTTNVSASY